MLSSWSCQTAGANLSARVTSCSFHFISYHVLKTFRGEGADGNGSYEITDCKLEYHGTGRDKADDALFQS